MQTNDNIFKQLALQEDLRVLKAAEIMEALFEKERTKNIKANLIALEVKSQALLS